MPIKAKIYLVLAAVALAAAGLWIAVSPSYGQNNVGGDPLPGVNCGFVSLRIIFANSRRRWFGSHHPCGRGHIDARALPADRHVQQCRCPLADGRVDAKPCHIR